MIWAIKNNIKTKAIPKSKAKCPICNEELISKCGNIKIWHWAHKSKNDCDNWYEPESIWHLKWKNEFPKEQQEIVIKKGDEYHIADIKTTTGKVIELQHSNISSENIEKREEFYGDIIWLLDGDTFGKNILFKNKCLLWKWMPSIIKVSEKDVFVDLRNGTIIKIISYWKFKNKIYCEYQSYSKKQFLHIYGDIYDKFSEITKIKNGNLNDFRNN